MTSLQVYVKENYDYLFHNHAAPHTKDWYLINSPWPTITVSMLYLCLCLYIGPLYMKNRSPFKLRRLVLAYNAFQVCLSASICVMAVQAGWFNGLSLLECLTLRSPLDNKAKIMAVACYWYFISKFIDLIDTVFFVLRKKYDHISLLHIGHHGFMPISVWYAARFIPDGHVTFIGLLNSFVHVVMYSYYFLAGFGPGMQKYLWWKKYLTIFQMAQFVILFLHQVQILFIDCNYPKFYVYWGFAVAPTLLILFGNFYVESYKRRGKQRLQYISEQMTKAIPCHNFNAYSKNNNFDKDDVEDVDSSQFHAKVVSAHYLT